MAGLTAGISGDGVTDKRRVAAIIADLKNGNTMVLKMYSDDYIRQYASKEDFDFWISEKEPKNSPQAAA